MQAGGFSRADRGASNGGGRPVLRLLVLVALGALTSGTAQAQSGVTLSLDSGGGQGTISVDGVSHSLLWQGAFSTGQTVTLEAVPATGWQFVRWDGDLLGSANPDHLTLDASKAVFAVFDRPRHQVTFRAVPPTGGGLRGASSFYENDPAFLTAYAAPGWRFQGWSEDLSGTANPILVGGTQDLTAQANFAPIRQTTVVYRQTFEADAVPTWSDWELTGNWAVLPYAHAKPGIPSDPSPYGPAALVYEKTGDYGLRVTASAITPPIDCSQSHGVVLTFLRSLTIDDGIYDQATVAVSTDKHTWTTVYRNPARPDPRCQFLALTDPRWYDVSYDISAVADGRKTVYVRWTLASDATEPSQGHAGLLHGWAIDDVTVSGAGPEVAVSYTPSGLGFPAGLTAYGPYPALESTLWQLGPAQSGGGQVRDLDGDPATPEQGAVGVDPGHNAAMEPSGMVLGTALGGNYPAGMSAEGTGPQLGPQYLQWGPLDLTGLQQTTLAFSRWLAVGAGKLDRASVQVHVATTKPAGDTLGALEPEVAAEVTTPLALSQASPRGSFAVGTGEHYAPLAVDVTYNTKGLAAGEVLRLQYTLDSAAASPTWVTFAGGQIEADTYDAAEPGEGAQTITFRADGFASRADYLRAQDDAAFSVRGILTQSNGTALDPGSAAAATLSRVRVSGVLWRYVWDNRRDSPQTEILDWVWTPVSYDLSQFGADGCPNVWVRWSLGPTDRGFETEYGGWNLDQLQILSASHRVVTEQVTAPAALAWGQRGEVSVTIRNAGTATWNGSYRLYEVQGEQAPTDPNPGAGELVEHLLGEVPAGSEWRGARAASAPGGTGEVIPYPGDVWGNGYLVSAASDPQDPLSAPIARWGTGSAAVSGPVAPGGRTTVTLPVTAPPFSPVSPWAQLDPRPDVSRLDCDWGLGTETAVAPAEFLPMLINSGIPHASIVTTRFTDDAVDAEGKPFWARAQIEELAGRVPMVVQGYRDGSYRPGLPVTRDQMAVYMARAAGLPLDRTVTPHFGDVLADQWAFAEIGACYRAGIVTGYPDHSYQPDLVVTREQMAKFVTLAAGYPIVAAPARNDEPGWFTDVVVQLPDGWKPGDQDPRNVFRDYIRTLQLQQIVTGYPTHHPDNSVTYTYRPGEAVTRDQLAVYLWRAFVETRTSVVVLGGPGVTAVPLTTGKASYYGYTNAGTPFLDGPFAAGAKAYPSALVDTHARSFAYITLEPARLRGATEPLTVTFSLLPVWGPTTPAASHTETIPAETLTTWVSEMLAEPPYGQYRNVAWAIPTGLQGGFRLVVTVDGGALPRQPFLSVLAPMYAERFESDDALGYWTASGQPVTPGPAIYPVDYLAGDPNLKPNRDWYEGQGALELQKSQQVVRLFPTTGRHNLRVSLRYAQDGNLGPNESLSIEWSPDYGVKSTQATWTNLATVKGSAVPTALPEQPVVFTLPNGDPTADPPVIGADDNESFAIRLSINAASKAKVYFDDLELAGT